MVATLEREATAIWAPYGVDLRWESPACVAGDVSFDVIVERHVVDGPADRAVLGSTHVQLTCTDRVPISIDAGATEKMLGSLTADEMMEAVGRPRVRSQDVGRALGRVLAHEIGHVILGLPNHQQEGLMRRAFHPIDMVSPLRAEYGLSPFELARLRNRAEAILAQRDRDGSTDPEAAAGDYCYHHRAPQEASRSDGTVQPSSHDAGARPGASFRQ